ncbi:MAG: phasin family protein [Armatimonadota bacterium]
MNILDFMKRSIEFGLGAAIFSAEKIKQLAEEMVSRGEMTSEEARKFVDGMTKRAEEEKRAIQEWIQQQVSKMIKQAGAAELARVEELERRVTALEEMFKASEPESRCESGSEGDN